MKPELEARLKQDVHALIRELIRVQLGQGDTATAERWLDDWEKEGGLSGTFERLVRQAEEAPGSRQYLSGIDRVVVYTILLPLAARWDPSTRRPLRE
jgi:hypothetical protein